MKSTLRYVLTSMLGSLCLMSVHNAAAGVVVIVHPSNQLATLTDSEVQKIYLGKLTHFPNGNTIDAVDQAEPEPSRKMFYKQVVRKDGAQLKAYWAKIIFTGDGLPPETKGDSTAVKAWVASHPDAIGYIDDTALDQTVKSVFRLP